MTLYDPLTLQPHKTISRFKDVSLSCSFRQDGRLLSASSADGVIQSFDLSSRLILRTYKGHTAPVWSVRHSGDFGQLLSAGDDGQVRVWDVSSGECVRVWQAGAVAGGAGSEDGAEVRAESVRVVREVEGESDMVVSGGYDGVVRYWDKRVKDETPVLALSHGAPINALLLIPKSSNASALSCISAADVTLKAWDIRYIASSSAVSPVHTLSNHQKAITTLSADSSYSKLLSGSLDGFVKITSLPGFTTLSSIKHTSPILSLALSPDSSMLAIGSADGSLTLKQRPAPTPPPQPRSLPRMGSQAWFNRGVSAQPASASAPPAGVNNAVARRSALQAYDVYLKRFQYHQALDAALRTNRAATIAAMLEELVDRSALLTAISGRSEEGLAPLLFFLLNYLVHPLYSAVMLDVIGCVLSVYGRRVGESVGMDEWVRRVRERVREECGVQEAMVRMRGGMEMMWRASETIEADRTRGEADKSGEGGGVRVEEYKEEESGAELQLADEGGMDVEGAGMEEQDEETERKETVVERTDSRRRKQAKKNKRSSEQKQEADEDLSREEKRAAPVVVSSARKKSRKSVAV